ncbi:phosphodiester glycosidase family protein [Winogradskya consettensis]|uniref:phosphodiester glycosidase family protein n=1 Tax=Winogradskya consettensis TaxID=113560 RepID=UPI001BB38E61|nr:phosphodiester glycosidase family protein [Actinoplanes consettensis]
MIAAVLAPVLVLVTYATPAAASSMALPLGDPDLPEQRTIETLASGVTLTRIVRGDTPAPADQIGSTTRGPWRINVLTIDPYLSRIHLRATYGPDLARTETTTDLVRAAGALAGVNASFFTYTASADYPGDPVGLGLYDGNLLSEPTGAPAETDMLVDSRRNKVLIGRLLWTGAVQNRRSHAALPIEFLNHPPVVPQACQNLTDQTTCTAPGDTVRFTPEFAASTPSGAGVEVVLDAHGCVVRTAATRGTTLDRRQSSLQATGADTAALLALAQGCLRQTSTLTDENGTRVPVTPDLQGVNGRYRLVADGEIAVPAGSDSFFARNPRTIAGTTRTGDIILATIDGRLTTSVGTTLDETAAVAKALGLHDAINLDGGGSTAMSVRGTLINQPSSGPERAVGDALILTE